MQGSSTEVNALQIPDVCTRFLYDFSIAFQVQQQEQNGNERSRQLKVTIFLYEPPWHSQRGLSKDELVSAFFIDM